MFKDQTILITGGTGSWGQELARTLLTKEPREIRILSRGEDAQVRMQRSISNPSQVTFIIGDIRDTTTLFKACRGVQIVYHLAALKHVPICEHQPEEALKTNVQGTENVIRAALNHRVDLVINVSTDKAADPVNFYGMTKAFGEKLTLRANELSSHTRFVCVRGGNVLGSNGSVVPYFKTLIREKRVLPITSRHMTRFFLTLPEAIQLLLEATQVAVGGETFIMKMPACRIMDLAEVMQKKLASGPLQIEEIGIRPGEKLHEVLVSSTESLYTRNFNDHLYVILPSHLAETNVLEHYQTYPLVSFDRYTSDQSLLSHQEIEKLLIKSGLLV